MALRDRLSEPARTATISPERTKSRSRATSTAWRTMSSLEPRSLTIIAAANGLGMERALEAITLSPARILGIDDRVGSIEVGKDADLALFDGDPFEYTSHICGVIIESEVMSAECR